MGPSKWHKGILEWTDGGTAFLSIVFTWHVDDAIARAVWLRALGYNVRFGGPGTLRFKRELEEYGDVGGPAPQEIVVMHNPDATFASRGCPVGCWFCIVPKIEGREFTLIDDFTPRPVLCDNNLSALPAEFQDHIVRRYRETGVPLLDAQSGFEPATFSAEVYRRWESVNRGPWRFAFDEEAERADVERTMRMLRDVKNARRKRVYVLIGNEPVDSCMDRIQSVIAWGGEPHVQPIIKLNARQKRPWVRFDWTEKHLKDVARWANRRLWKYVDFAGYRTGTRTGRGGALQPHPELPISAGDPT